MPRARVIVAAAALVGCGLAACSNGSGGSATSAPTSVASTSSTAQTTAASSSPAASTSSSSAAPPVSTSTRLSVQSFVTGLQVPWGIGFLPDGTALVTDRDSGAIHAISKRGKVSDVGRIHGVRASGEAGLLGLAVSPTFTSDHRIYVYYSAVDDNRIARVTYRDGRLTDQQDILTGIPRGPFHNGGALVFGPDHLLYVGTGDAMDHPAAQRLSYLGGKILRIQPNGKGAPGNPFPKAPLVYTYGHRNIEGLAFDSSGRLWESEFGENTWDELNLIKRGGNYGWPIFEGKSHNPKYVSPLWVWHTPDASPSGIAIWRGSAWLASLRGERLWQVPLNGTSTGTPKARFTGTYGRLRAAVVAPDGSLWVTTSNTDGRGSPHQGDDRILRITVK